MPRNPQNRQYDQRGPQGGRQGQRPSPGPMLQLPDSYFSVDAGGNHYLQTDFVSRKVDELARGFAQDRLSASQARRFFSHCREIERRLKIQNESWELVSADFVKILSFAQYARARNTIPPGFEMFLDQNVQRVIASDNPREAFLQGFIPHFEALIGFGAAHFRAN